MKCSLFTEDFTIFISRADIINGQDVLQKTINRLDAWATESGKQFSKIETIAMHFCLIRRCNYDTNLYLKQAPIPPSHFRHGKVSSLHFRPKFILVALQ